MKQKRQRKWNDLIHNEQGVALLYALVVMAVLFALSLALLYGVGQVSLMSGSHREQDDDYIQAVTLSQMLDQQLTMDTTSGIYKAAISYMPDCDSESVMKSQQFRASADHLPTGYGDVVIRFQNGVDTERDSNPDWESKELSNQYLNLTVEVFGQKGGKQSVTTGYKYYQELSDDDMKYTLFTDRYTGKILPYECVYTTDDAHPDGFFTVTDRGPLCIEDDKYVTMEMAEEWAGTIHAIGTVTYIDSDGNEQTVNNASVQIKRERNVLHFEGDETYGGLFKKINTR